MIYICKLHWNSVDRNPVTNETGWSNRVMNETTYTSSVKLVAYTYAPAHKTDVHKYAYDDNAVTFILTRLILAFMLYCLK